MHRVRFQPSGLEIEVPAGTTLLDAATTAGLPIARSCGAGGLCSRCGLRIVEGGEHLAPESPEELQCKARNRVDPALRLACRTEIRGDLTVTALYW